MKIQSLDLFTVPPRWLFLKVTTDEGVTGWGEPVLEGHAQTVAACVREMEDYLLGHDPMAIEDTWQTLYRSGFYRGGPVLMSAIAGIDQALWDIKGKTYGLPVYQLLGGPRVISCESILGLAEIVPPMSARRRRQKKSLDSRPSR